MALSSKYLSDDVQHKIHISEDYIASLNTLVLPTDHVILVTSKGFVKRGHVEDIRQHIVCEKFHLVDDVIPNPELAYIDTLCQNLIGVKVTHIIALGGGSVIDTAKVLTALLESQYASVRQLLSSESHEIKNSRLTTIPTTAGTGAEVTPFATVWDAKNKKKYSVTNVQATHIILSPTLTFGLSKFDTMVTALDALSHAIESLWNVGKSERSEHLAKQAIALITENLQIAMDQPSNSEARAALQYAAFLSGLAISETKTALAHAMSYPITLEFNVPHGLACSFTLLSLLNKVGAQRLKLSRAQVDNLITLLASLNLNEEISKYANMSELLNAVDRELDPSRAGNFILPVTSDLVTAVIKESMDSVHT